MIRRKTYDKLPLQGNVYPMPTMAYIEDNYVRLNILASQPSGVACLQSGKDLSNFIVRSNHRTCHLSSLKI